MTRLEIFEKTSSNAFKLYAMIEMMCNATKGECNFSNWKLSKMLNMPEKAVIKAKKELKDFGLLNYISQRNGNRNSITKYTIATPTAKKAPTTNSDTAKSDPVNFDPVKSDPVKNDIDDNNSNKDNNIYNMNNNEYDRTVVPEVPETKKEHSAYFNELKVKLDSMYISKQLNDFKRIQRAYIALYDESYKKLSEYEYNSIQKNYNGILKAKCKYFKTTMDELYISTKEDDEVFLNDFCGGASNNSNSEFSKPKPEPAQPIQLSEEQQAILNVGSLIGYDLSAMI